jgi:hypothetical protein
MLVQAAVRPWQTAHPLQHRIDEQTPAGWLGPVRQITAPSIKLCLGLCLIRLCPPYRSPAATPVVFGQATDSGGRR